MKYKFSICIPTTELKYSDGSIMGVYMLNFLLKSINNQTYKDFEIIIADHSSSDIIEKECLNWSNLDIKYFKNENKIGSAAANLNFAISKASGKYIKTIFQDDYFYSPKTLEYIINNINEHSWGALGTYHIIENNMKLIKPFEPKWGNELKILSGSNSVSGPSVIFFKNDNNYFDENLGWLNDVEFYYRLFLKYGRPVLLIDKMIVQRLRKQGVSRTLSKKLKLEEKNFVQIKHKIINGSNDIKKYPAMYNRLKNIK